MFDQYAKDNVIETKPIDQVTPDFICNLNPLKVVPKDEHEVRPVLNCTSSHLNEALAPHGMDLPSILNFLCQTTTTNGTFGKRDFRHGFFHCTIKPEFRKYLGFKYPNKENEVWGRFIALAFGLSQSPARFQELTKTFTQILIQELKNLGIQDTVLSIFVDDLGVYSTFDMNTLFEIANDLADVLGMVFKTTKDEVD